jgi:hypothetical protein
MTCDYIKRLGAQGHQKVRQALRKWDPIGVYRGGSDFPDDEYEAYSAPLVALLDHGRPKSEIVAYLKKVCVEQIEVAFDCRHTETIVDELLAFWPAWKAKVRDLGSDYIEE